MSSLKLVWEVSRWEFLRYVKPKQQIVGFIITFAMFGVGWWIGGLGGEPSVVELPVAGAEHLGTLPAEAGRFRFEPVPAGEVARLEQAVREEERDALLILRADGTGELQARRAPGWLGELERELSLAIQTQRLAESGISAEQLAAVQAPFALSVREHAPRSGGAERFAGFLAIGVAMLGLFSGVSYIFSSVTGEKQNRLSEQVISAVPPQSWIDGKIVGLSAVSLVGVLNMMLAAALFFGLGNAFWGWSFPLPTGIERPGPLAVAILFVLLGYLFWFAFLTAVAAIMDDPHTSTRNQLIFLPILATIPAFMAVSNPEAGWIHVLSILPPTSGTVLPARLLMDEVAAWEVLLALLLLCLAIWAMRWAAARIFRIGMLMYGKEPSWGEVRRWVREGV